MRSIGQIDAGQVLLVHAGQELFVTGGEPFLHPQIGELITELARRLPVTVLTNAMTFHRAPVARRSKPCRASGSPFR